MNDLDERLRDYYQRKAPEKSFTSSLLSVGELMSSRQESRLPAKVARLWRRSALVKAASLAMVLVLVSGVGHVLHERGSLFERTRRTVQEVAMNHTTRLGLEHLDSSVDALNERMDQLPFSLTVPASLRDDYALVGSRYCSLAGHLAAHMKLRKRDSGEAVSLFITPLEKDLEPMQGEHGTVAGVEVDLWQEDGLFFAMARR